MIDNEFGNDILTLEDDDGVEHTFEVLDAIDNGENRYMALSPVYDDPQIKISDVAKEAGVSISTVSNVINRKGTTKKETEALVLETIDRLGYIPNRMAQGLKSNRTNVIGIIAEDIKIGRASCRERV